MDRKDSVCLEGNITVKYDEFISADSKISVNITAIFRPENGQNGGQKGTKTADFCSV